MTTARLPADVASSQPAALAVERVLQQRLPFSTTEIASADELRREASNLGARAEMTVTPTPRARPAGDSRVTAGMMLVSAAPVMTPDGRCLGVLYGGVLLNRSYGIVDKVVGRVFKEQRYQGRLAGTATIFQDDVRISTNVMDAAGSRAKVEVDGDDEIGHMATSFNAMTSDLSRANQELVEWGDALERKVEQRTGELQATQARLVQSGKLAAVGRLAAGVAHEINNPLTGVLTNASLMLGDLPEADPRREELQTIVSETLRCRKIVKGLLDFARQTKPQKQALSLNQIVEDILALVRNQAGFRNVHIVTELAPRLPLVAADGDQVRQVMLNIILNAADAMPGGGELTIASGVDAGARTVSIRISDTGPGIPEGVKDRLFEPFFTTKSTGTGLGLAIAYGIIEQHGGSLIVDSAPGRGTTVVVALPMKGTNTDVSRDRHA